MANNYTQSSSMLEIPKDKREQAVRIVDRIRQELEDGEEGYVGFVATFEDEGLWIRDDRESFAAAHVVELVQELLDELQIDESFIFSWAYTCDKPRVDEFGGGACAVRRNKEPVWCDARNEVEAALINEEERQLAQQGGTLEAGLRLYTKDGRNMGNAVILEVLPPIDGDQVYWYQTDCGRQGYLHAEEIYAMWHTTGEGVSAAAFPQLKATN